MQNRGGGAIENMPNHMKGLVFWNYTQTNSAVNNFEFWASNDIWWKIPTPIIAGFKGAGSSFKADQLSYMEGVNEVVSPLSLYEAQLQLRLKKIPDWISQVKQSAPSGF